MIKVEEVPDQESSLELLTQQFKAATKKSSGAALEMAETIVRADEELKDDLHAAFYNAIGLDPKGSTVRKFRQIGRVSSRFKPYLDKLPSNWTTLYRLAHLEGDEFETLMSSDALHPLATWVELENELGREREEKEQSLRVHFDLNDVPVLRQAEFVGRLDELCTDFDVRYEATKACRAKLESLTHVPFGTNAQEASHTAI